LEIFLVDEPRQTSTDGETGFSSDSLLSEDMGLSASRLWMQRSRSAQKHMMLNANQHTSLSAMISYISAKSGQSEIRIERKLSDHFHIPNPKCLPANDYDDAIRYLADIISA